jgi:predicted phage terminase large subunit-like protein
MEAVNQLSLTEAVSLGAINSEIYARTFFPKTFRQATPAFQKEVWNDLDNPTVRFLNEQMFRGSAKTTLARVFSSKRIAYGVSKTILYIGASESAAVRSGTWLRNNIERNKLWTSTFGLSKGRKWTDSEFEIDHATLGQTIWVMCVGVQGNLRGINFDDYRPDLIVCDDILDDENCASFEQREKITNIVHGAVKRSLAPVVDEPNAKMIMLVTPQHKEDVSHRAKADPQWKTIEVPCWTKETLGLPVEQQISAWEERIPTKDLRADKKSAMVTNTLSIFTREMEVRLVSRESSSFHIEWLSDNYYDPATIQGTHNILSIDPVPPPSDAAVAKGNVGKDWEVHHVWGRRGDDYYLLDSARSRGHDPSWSLASAFALAMRWRVAEIVVESVAYQRVLKWLLEEEMKRRKTWFTVIPYVDKRAKFTRITSAFGGLASAGHVHIRRGVDTEFASQFESYPNTDHDDELDAAAIALSRLSNPWAAGLSDADVNYANVEPIRRVRGAP